MTTSYQQRYPQWFIAMCRVAVCIVCTTTAQSVAKPNIIIINADDLGYGDLGCYGATKLKTPHIDRLAKEGRRFTDAHSASAVCSPSRYGLLTGRYPLRKNFWGPLPTTQALTINPSHLTIASLLKESGYDTACIGKWHLGFGSKEPDWNGSLKPGPLELGFDYYFGIPSVNSGPPFVYVENHHVLGADPADPLVYGKKSVTKKYPEKSAGNIGGGKKAHQLYVDEMIGTTLKNKAVEWIKTRKQTKPFFLYLATTNIHHPFTPAKQFVGTSECGLYGDFVHELDWMVGEVLAALEEMKMADSTLVIFTSDNGGMLNITGQKARKAGHHSCGDLLGYKFGAWEGGHRVPMITRWPGKIPAATTSHHLISQVDLAATFAAIVDRPLKKGEAVDSVDQLKNLISTLKAPLRKTLIISPNSPKHLTVRHGKWVYIPSQDEGGFQGKKLGSHVFGGAAAIPFSKKTNSDVVEGKIRSDAPPAQLYNLETDPSQTTNLYTKHPEVVTELKAILKSYRSKIPKTKPVGWINLKQKKKPTAKAGSGKK